VRGCHIAGVAEGYTHPPGPAHDRAPHTSGRQGTNARATPPVRHRAVPCERGHNGCGSASSRQTRKGGTHGGGIVQVAVDDLLSEGQGAAQGLLHGLSIKPQHETPTPTPPPPPHKHAPHPTSKIDSSVHTAHKQLCVCTMQLTHSRPRQGPRQGRATVNSQQPTANSQQPTANSQQPQQTATAQPTHRHVLVHLGVDLVQGGEPGGVPHRQRRAGRGTTQGQGSGGTQPRQLGGDTGGPQRAHAHTQQALV
jgi:hypothetical protein